ncbi:MAG TPA: TIM barrel protein [Pirellulaceae bacterium]|nr:TIM barrel protein [Pirellulaceae bacterium]
MQKSELSRRMMLGTMAAGSALAVTNLAHADPASDDPNWKITRGRINQSVVHWCFKPLPVEDLARAAAGLGIKSVELVPPSDWPILKKYGLTCAIAGSHGFVKGWNDKANWDFCTEKITQSIDAAAEFGCKSVITFSGMRGELPAAAEGDEIGKKNFVEGIQRVLPLAEQKKVTLALEMLNSRVDIEMKGHPGYQCDSIEWAVDVCNRVGSDRLKILYDIYHVQIMQGDVITRLKQYKDYIAHYHTAGNPGRNEIDDTQEINYPGIMRAIAETGYTGFVGQEFIPTWKDPIAALRHAARVCDV